MKILEIHKYYYLRRGAERHFLDLMALLTKYGHEVGVFAMEHPKNIPSPWNKYFVSHVGYNQNDSNFWERVKGIGRIFWSFEARRNIQALLSEWRPEVVHIHNMYHQLSPSILKPLKDLSVPIIMTVHDYNLISPDKDAYYPEIGKRYWKFLFVKKYSFLKRVLLVLKKYWEHSMGFYRKNIDGYIVPSLYVKNVFIGAGIPEEKISVLPHFIPENEAALPQSTPEPFAVYFGSVSQEKNINALVDIFGSLSISLVIAGMRENGFVPHENKYVSFVGQKSKEELEALIGRAACVVSCSELPETFGLIALESIASGKPFFGLKTGALPEIIENGKNGFLADDTDSLKQHLSDFFNGRLVFDANAIQQDASLRFSEKRYIQNLENIFSSYMLPVIDKGGDVL